jgi:hypothetical protein
MLTDGRVPTLGRQTGSAHAGNDGRLSLSGKITGLAAQQCPAGLPFGRRRTTRHDGDHSVVVGWLTSDHPKAGEAFGRRPKRGSRAAYVTTAELCDVDAL